MSRTIKARMQNGEVRIIEGIPDDAKVTFSRANPSKMGFEPYALRIYTSNTNQLACLLNVEEFCDASLTVQRVVKDVQRTHKKREDEQGIDVTDNFAATNKLIPAF